MARSRGRTPPEESQGERRSVLKFAVQGAFTVFVFVLVFGWAIPNFASYEEIGETLGDLTPEWLVALTIVAILNILANGPMLATVAPPLTWWQGVDVMTESNGTSNALPMGAAMGQGVKFAALLRNGLTPERATSAMVADGLTSTLLRFGLPIVAVIIAALNGEGDTAIFIGALIGIALFAAAIWLAVRVLRSDRVAARVASTCGRAEAWVRRKDRDEYLMVWEQRVADFRTQSAFLLERRGVAAIAMSTVVNLAYYLVLLTAVRAVGIGPAELSWQWVLVGFSIGRLASIIAPTPGGLGITDFFIVAALQVGAAPTVSESELVAATVVFRMASWLPVTVIGLGLLWWHTRKRVDERLSVEGSGNEVRGG